MDARHVTYEVVFPRDLSLDAGMAFLHAVSGLTSYPGRPFQPAVFRLYGDSARTRHYISASAGKADYVQGQLFAHIPGLSLVRESLPEVDWTDAVELKSGRRRKPQKVATAVDDARSVLEAMRRLADGEALCLEWTLVPRRTEDDDPEAMFRATGRILAAAGHPKRAAHLISRALGPVRSLHRYGVDFTERLVPGWWVVSKAARSVSPVLSYPSDLPASALLVLAGFPFASPTVSGLALSRGRKLAPDALLPSVGFVLGAANFPGMERRIAIDPADALKHVYAIGPPGSGKTVLMQNQIIQQMEQGHGLSVIDGDGDLSRDLLARVPKQRVQDVTYFDLTDEVGPIGYNPLEGDPYQATESFMGVFDRLFGIQKLAQTSEALHYSVLALSFMGMSIVDIPSLLMPGPRGKPFREQAKLAVPSERAHDFWESYEIKSPQEQYNTREPLMRRLRRFGEQPSLQASLGQTKSGFDLDEIMNQGKILIVHAPRGRIGDSASAIIGSLVVSRIWGTALARAATAENRRRPHFVSIDEFHKHLNVADDVADIFAQARKYKLGLFVAHQDISQMPLHMRGSMASNCRTKLVFQPGAADAQALEREFRGYLSAEQLQGLVLTYGSSCVVRAGGREVLLPGVGVVEVQPAGAVQGLLGGADG